MPSRRSATYTYEELADRIGQTLGERPSLSALRAEITRRPQTVQRQRPRLTAGLPSPLQPRTSPARFSAAEVESWLKHHPRRRWQRAVDQARRGFARPGAEPEKVVGEALRSGLSWRVLTDLFNTATGSDLTVAGFHKRYRHLTPP